ncbi:LOW QUALITY PROTEIN: low-density lipoprotein receptor class A domain-containing protein 1-like [Diretmus argenteus]
MATAKNDTGFLCDDRATCVPPSDLCDGVVNCLSGADEDSDMCSNGPLVHHSIVNSNRTEKNQIHSSFTVTYVIYPADPPDRLPGDLVFHCGNPQNWIFIDKKCDHINDCGDCSDETGMYAGCPPSCSRGWWPCTPVDFQFCDCIPRSLCQDSQQHCHDWSDEYTCPKIS